MSRIEKGYEAKFRAHFRQINASKVEQRVKRLLDRARRLTVADGLSRTRALAHVFRLLQKQIDRWQKRRRPNGEEHVAAPAPVPHFFCDAGLGGLARWLRAAGYEAVWTRDIDDDELLRQARRRCATVVTTDSLLMERRVVRDGAIAALWVPPSLTMAEQLESVLQELQLPLLEPRCMECGGELQKRDKQEMRQQIPPRTYLWLDDYFVCRRCDKLFWHGTHWQQIQAQLQRLSSRARL